MAVAMSASPTPPVMAVGWPDSRLKTENEVIMPLIVPSRPSNGAIVTMTLR